MDRARATVSRDYGQVFARAVFESSRGSRKPRAGGWKAEMQISRYSRKRLSSLAYLYPPVCTALVPPPSHLSTVFAPLHRFLVFHRFLLPPPPPLPSHAPTSLSLSPSTLDLLRPRLYTFRVISRLRGWVRIRGVSVRSSLVFSSEGKEKERERRRGEKRSRHCWSGLW